MTKKYQMIGSKIRHVVAPVGTPETERAACSCCGYAVCANSEEQKFLDAGCARQWATPAATEPSLELDRAIWLAMRQEELEAQRLQARREYWASVEDEARKAAEVYAQAASDVAGEWARLAPLCKMYSALVSEASAAHAVIASSLSNDLPTTLTPAMAAWLPDGKPYFIK